MKKLLVAVGVPAGIATLAIVASMVASAAVGDAIYVKSLAQVSLSAAQKTDLQNAIAGPFSGVAFADMKTYYCRQVLVGADQGKFKCRCTDEQTKTAAELLDLDIAGEVTGAVQGDGTHERRAPDTELTSGQETTHDTFTQSTVSLDMGNLVDFKCMRDPNDSNIIDCDYNQFVTATPATYLTDRSNGDVVRVIGKVVCTVDADCSAEETCINGMCQ